MNLVERIVESLKPFGTTYHSLEKAKESEAAMVQAVARTFVEWCKENRVDWSPWSFGLVTSDRDRRIEILARHSSREELVPLGRLEEMCRNPSRPFGA